MLLGSATQFLNYKNFKWLLRNSSTDCLPMGASPLPCLYQLLYCAARYRQKIYFCIIFYSTRTAKLYKHGEKAK